MVQTIVFVFSAHFACIPLRSLRLNVFVFLVFVVNVFFIASITKQTNTGK